MPGVLVQTKKRKTLPQKQAASSSSQPAGDGSTDKQNTRASRQLLFSLQLADDGSADKTLTNEGKQLPPCFQPARDGGGVIDENNTHATTRHSALPLLVDFSVSSNCANMTQRTLSRFSAGRRRKLHVIHAENNRRAEAGSFLYPHSRKQGASWGCTRRS